MSKQPLTNEEEQLLERYHALCHAMQTGVAFEQEKGSQDARPKHLRVGINTAKCEHAALVHMLMTKGIIDRTEYFREIITFMEREVKNYEERIATNYKVSIKLFISTLLAVILVGCASPKKFTIPSALYPPVATKELAPVGKDRVTLAWNNTDYGLANTNYATGVEASTDLVTWTLVGVLPYETAAFFTLTNRPSREFYRVYNTIK